LLLHRRKLISAVHCGITTCPSSLVLLHNNNVKIRAAWADTAANSTAINQDTVK